MTGSALARADSSPAGTSKQVICPAWERKHEPSAGPGT
jgi:hypothetical protein